MAPWVSPVMVSSRKLLTTNWKFTYTLPAGRPIARAAGSELPTARPFVVASSSALRRLLVGDDLAAGDLVRPHRHRRRVQLTVGLELEVGGDALAGVRPDEGVQLVAGGVARLDAGQQDVGRVERLGAVRARVAPGGRLVVGGE